MMASRPRMCISKEREERGTSFSLSPLPGLPKEILPMVYEGLLLQPMSDTFHPFLQLPKRMQRRTTTLFANALGLRAFGRPRKTTDQIRNSAKLSKFRFE